jgi:hypothetical protein
MWSLLRDVINTLYIDLPKRQQGIILELISRKHAKEQGHKHYYTGQPCKYGHISQRLTSTGHCGECTRLRHYSWYEKNKEQALSIIGKWQQKNKDVVNTGTRDWRKNNPQSAKETHKRYYTTHKETKLQFNKLWRERNKPLLQYYNSKRRAQIKRASVDWADIGKMIVIYEQSVSMSRETGIMYQVDHIVPLQHKLVCGLHWEGNLQILSKKENQHKGNQFIN